ncbi:hypothetical protein [Bacillus safensis]|uniref:Uncharacterized protein n=1 Tax=Bacillus safensis TaxID=561879 RepID=A0A1L6ZPA3_BACIA|nr:hypothetical protein [Bacillus safensis]APT48333.1 hypothetical protein BSA145_20940 [Bacillus safensis]
MNFTTEQKNIICDLFQEYEREELEYTPEHLQEIDYNSFLGYAELMLASRNYCDDSNKVEQELISILLSNRTKNDEYSDELINAFKNALINQ